uniref:Uncharacterized protein n=1 Tax=Oryza glaberrima TaxID=4538 RepID=I1PP28_ORYGL
MPAWEMPSSSATARRCLRWISGLALRLLYRPNGSQHPFALSVCTSLGPLGSPTRAPFAISTEFNLLCSNLPIFSFLFKPASATSRSPNATTTMATGRGKRGRRGEERLWGQRTVVRDVPHDLERAAVVEQGEPTVPVGAAGAEAQTRRFYGKWELTQTMAMTQSLPYSTATPWTRDYDSF